MLAERAIAASNVERAEFAKRFAYALIACGVTPSEANRLDSNSTFTCSTWRPITSTLFTPATPCNARLMSSASTCVSAWLSSGACNA